MKEPHLALNPPRKNPRIFYGWWMVGACFIISMYITGTVVFGFTALIEPIAQEFGWSYTQISFAASLRGVESGLLSPVLGILADRIGSKKVIFTGMAIGGLGLLVLSRTTSLAIFYGAFFLISVSAVAATSPVTMTAIAHWFRRRFGLAAGIVSSGVGLGGLVVYLLVFLIDKYDWRMAMVIMGLGLWVIGLPLSLLIRKKPEQYGYSPDGDEDGDKAVSENVVSADIDAISIKPRQALGSRTFLHLALSFLCGGLIISTVTTHIMPYLGSIGISREVAGLSASSIPLASIAGRLGFGWIADKTEPKHAAALSYALFGVGFLCFSYITGWGNWLLIPSLILIGIGYGGNAIMIQALARAYFGKSKFGTMMGFIVGVIWIGQMVGPPLAGWVFDEWGSYISIWLSFIVLAIISIAIVMATPSFFKERR